MITRNTVFVYKGKRRDVKKIGRVAGGRRLTPHPRIGKVPPKGLYVTLEDSKSKEV